jgi:hypothetical protein
MAKGGRLENETNGGLVVASFMQGPYLSITPGAYAEAVFPMYPGRVFPEKVLTTIDLAAEKARSLQSASFPASTHRTTRALPPASSLTTPTICDCRRVRRGAPRYTAVGSTSRACSEWRRCGPTAGCSSQRDNHAHGHPTVNMGHRTKALRGGSASFGLPHRASAAHAPAERW